MGDQVIYTRQAMIIEYSDGHREYSPDVEIVSKGGGAFTLKPIVPFERIPETPDG